MATVSSVPTLSSSGWVNTPAEKIDYLMTYFVYTIKNQTTVFGGNATSLQALLEAAGNDMNAATANVRSALITYLGRYYDSVNVDATYALTDPTNSASLATLTIAVTVTENGQSYSIEQQLQLLDGKFQSFIDITSNS
jgi:hypothetical protein